MTEAEYEAWSNKVAASNLKAGPMPLGTITGINKTYGSEREAIVDNWINMANSGEYGRLAIGPGGMGEQCLIVLGSTAGGAGGNPFPGLWNPPDAERPPPPPPPPVGGRINNWGSDMPPWYPLGPVLRGYPPPPPSQN